ncbi:MAG TPA: cobalamin-dependent protein, partial [Dehalococcoidales bacterium]|nr:cobalamin-dependent protein [Dehalococcoidales bacterium]
EICMPQYDVIFIHPPAIFDFRKKAIFPGPMGASVEQVQFNKVPIGLLSLAEYLDRHGYKVIIDNLGDRMLENPLFDAEQHLKSLSAQVLAVGLHFQQHSPGAMDVARLCKQHHPDALVVMGGLTATCFHQEIIQKYPFIDAVIRAEAEKPFLQFMRALEKNRHITPTPNLTYRNERGTVQVTPLAKPSTDLDEFDYTRLDLLEPRTSIFAPGIVPRWSLEVCRGCVYNCAICGGSAYSYKKYLGMDKPAFRSPAKIHQDIKSLNTQGIRVIGLYQDPRPAGQVYCNELFRLLKDPELEIDRLSIDLLVPADEEFVRLIVSTGRQVTVHICPDTGSDKVRAKLGRHYSTAEFLKTVQICHRHLVPVTTFLSTGLAAETRQEMLETWELWDKLSSLESIALARQSSLGLGSLPLGGPIMGPILLDPGSPAFDSPQQYGYKVLYRTLEEYIAALSGPSWLQWLNYETEVTNKQMIAEMIMQSAAFAIEQSLAYGFCNPAQAAARQKKLKLDIMAVSEIYHILQKGTPEECETRLKALKDRLAAGQ